MPVAKLFAPLALAATLLLVAGAACAEPALWVAEGPHGAKVYLFGTVHLTRPGTEWMTPKIQAAFDESHDLTLEIADIDNDAAAVPIVQRLGLDADHTLSSQLSPADRRRLAAAEASLGLPAAGVEHLKPWLAAVTLSVMPLQKQGFDPKAGVDRALERLAKAKGEPIGGFETLEQQLGYFADMPQPQQLSFLHEALKDLPTLIPDLTKLEREWAAGKVEALGKDMNEDMRKEDPKLYDLLITRRNEAFAAAIAKKLEGSGVSFVAVGAGHLAGSDSVQHDLEKQGYKVRRL